MEKKTSPSHLQFLSPLGLTEIIPLGMLRDKRPEPFFEILLL